MRSLLLLPLVALAACSTPCENIDAAQTDPAMQTCVFSASVDGEGVFSPEDGAPVAFAAPERVGMEGAFPDGSQIHDDMWVAPGEPLPTQTDSARWVSTTALAPEATRYALAMRTDGTVRIHDAGGRSMATVRVAGGEDATAARKGVAGWPNRATHLAYSPDGTVLFGADTQGNVTAWDAASGETVWTSAAPLDHDGQDGRAIKPDEVRQLAVSDDGGRVAVATTAGAFVWDAASGEALAAWAIPRTKTSVVGVSFAPGGEHVAVMSSGRYMPPTVRYSSFDENGQRTGMSEKLDAGDYQRAPTVFLMALP